MTTSHPLKLLSDNFGKIIGGLSLVLTFYGGWQLRFYLQSFGLGFPIELNLFPFVLPITGLISLFIILVLIAGVFSAPLFAATVFEKESRVLLPSTKKSTEKINHKAILAYISKIYLIPTGIWATFIFGYYMAFEEYPFSYAFLLLSITIVIYSAYISKTHREQNKRLSRVKVIGTYCVIGAISSWSAMISTLLVVKIYPNISDIKLISGLLFLVILNALCFYPMTYPVKTRLTGSGTEDLVETKPTLIWMLLVFIVVSAFSVTPRACEFIGSASLRTLGIGGDLQKRIIDIKSTKKDLPEALFDNEERTSAGNLSKPLNLILNSGSHSYFKLDGKVYKIKNDNFIEVTQIAKD